ncbi:MAG: hypothetical protein DRP94_03230 [Candidatus Latescibacterota bacterium]|nr:MAG: hypothetical protein DRP94_03230 [Candidatus Latescibacterota bacterium]
MGYCKLAKQLADKPSGTKSRCLNIVPDLIIYGIVPEIQPTLGSRQQVTDIIFKFLHNEHSYPCALREGNLKFYLPSLLHFLYFKVVRDISIPPWTIK